MLLRLSLLGLVLLCSCAVRLQQVDPETLGKIGEALVDVAKKGDGTVTWEKKDQVNTPWGSGTHEEKLKVELGQLE